DGGRYKKHVERLRLRLARMRRDARAGLESAGIEFDSAPGEGIFLWGRVPDAVPVDGLRGRELQPVAALQRRSQREPAARRVPARIPARGLKRFRTGAVAEAVQVREAREGDLEGLVAIYNDVLATSTAIFSHVPVTLAE